MLQTLVTNCHYVSQRNDEISCGPLYMIIIHGGPNFLLYWATERRPAEQKCHL